MGPVRAFSPTAGGGPWVAVPAGGAGGEDRPRPCPPSSPARSPCRKSFFHNIGFSARFFTDTGENPEGMHRYACGMHHLMHTFDPMKTLGTQGIGRRIMEGMHCMHLFSELLSFIPFSLMGHAYHAYRRKPPPGTGGTKRESEAGKVCIT